MLNFRSLGRTVFFVGAILWGAGCTTVSTRNVAGAGDWKGPLPVAFISDFSTVDDAVASCKGVMLGIEPRLSIVDITHQVRPYAIGDAARFLGNTAPHFPRGTVFVAVVDPGVGGVRRAIAARSKRGHYYVLPDNGLLTFVEDQDGIEEARLIEARDWLHQGASSSTFHGRDIFSPVAARLARGDDWTKLGPVVTGLVRLDSKRASISEKGLEAQAIALDGQYGNVITNASFELFDKLGYKLGDSIPVVIGKRAVRITLARWFSEVPEGKNLLYQDSTGRVALAVNMGNFAEKYRVKPPVVVRIPKK